MLNPLEMINHDDTSSLRWNAKSNNENLVTEKNYNNTSSLRLPADPSWPKIRSRRTPDNISDISEPVCEIFMGATPRRSQSITRAPSITSNINNIHERNNQGSFFDYPCPKISNQQGLRRRPGCLDPRFKKVTSMRPQVSPEPLNKHPSSLPESNRPLTISSTRNHDSFKLKRIESTATQTAPGNDLEDFPKLIAKDKDSGGLQNAAEKTEEDNLQEMKAPVPLSKLTILSNASVNVQSEGSSCECQGANVGYLNRIPLPVLTYQISPQAEGKIDVAPQLSIFYHRNPPEIAEKIPPGNPQKSESKSNSDSSDSEDIPEDSASQWNPEISKTPDTKNSKFRANSSPKNSNAREKNSVNEISMETQQRLTNEYWNFFKQSREMEGAKDHTAEILSYESMGAPETKRRKSEISDDNRMLRPLEGGALEHCTVLSSMINRTREREADYKEFGTPGSIFQQSLSPCRNDDHKIGKAGQNSLHCDAKVGERSDGRQIFKLKTFVLCGVAVYFVIILLQVLYENVYYEETDYYGDLNYFEYFLNYAMMSFREAFRQTFEL